MPTTKTVTLYKFEELSDESKERARDWWRESALHDQWWDAVYEDFERIAEILGIEFATHTVTLMSGKTRYDPNIWFSGFWSQGDGACFEGTYRYKKGAAKAIRDYAPQDEKLHAIADQLQAAQRKWFYGADVRLKKRDHHYSHEMTVGVEAFDRDGNGLDAESEDAFAAPLRDLMRWLYRTLEAEHEYLNSDESIDESMAANEYTFTEDGRREDP